MAGLESGPRKQVIYELGATWHSGRPPRIIVDKAAIGNGASRGGVRVARVLCGEFELGRAGTHETV